MQKKVQESVFRTAYDKHEDNPRVHSPVQELDLDTDKYMSLNVHMSVSSLLSQMTLHVGSLASLN